MMNAPLIIFGLWLSVGKVNPITFGGGCASSKRGGQFYLVQCSHWLLQMVCCDSSALFHLACIITVGLASCLQGKQGAVMRMGGVMLKLSRCRL